MMLVGGSVMRIWVGSGSAALAMLAACSPGDNTHANAPAVDAAVAPAVDAAVATACPDVPGTVSTLAYGELVGMDATRLFFHGDAGSMSWPKGGGVPVRIASEDLGSRLTISGGSYYWIAPGSMTINVTDADGALVRRVPLSSATNPATDLAVAPDGGVYVLTQCLPAWATPCMQPPSDMILLIASGSATPQTVVMGAQIGAMASGSDALIWSELDDTTPTPMKGHINKRDSTTGLVTTLLGTPAYLMGGTGSLLIASGEFFSSVFLESVYEPAIERRSMLDGSMLDSYSTIDSSEVGSGLPAGWFTSAGDLYWAEQPRVAYVACMVPGGVFRLHLAERTVQRLQPGPKMSPVLVDNDVVYYSWMEVNWCCPIHGRICPPYTQPPTEVRCYRQGE